MLTTREELINLIDNEIGTSTGTTMLSVLFVRDVQFFLSQIKTPSERRRFATLIAKLAMEASAK